MLQIIADLRAAQEFLDNNQDKYAWGTGEMFRKTTDSDKICLCSLGAMAVMNGVDPLDPHSNFINMDNVVDSLGKFYAIPYKGHSGQEFAQYRGVTMIWQANDGKFTGCGMKPGEIADYLEAMNINVI